VVIGGQQVLGNDEDQAGLPVRGGTRKALLQEREGQGLRCCGLLQKAKDQLK